MTADEGQPAFTPEVLVSEGTWMLTRDAGPQLRAVVKRREPAPSWDELLPLYAELQIELASDAEKLVALGALDKRPAMVSAGYSGLVERVGRHNSLDIKRLQALAPELESLTDALASPLPATVIHEEFHETTSSCATGRLAFSIWARPLCPTRSPGSSTRSATSGSGGDSSRTAGRCAVFDPFTSSLGRPSVRTES